MADVIPVPPVPAPAPPSSLVPDLVNAGILVAESFIPGAAAFNPLIAMALAAIKAHYELTHTWPTLDQLAAYIPADWQKLQDTWKGWVPSGDGTLK